MENIENKVAPGELNIGAVTRQSLPNAIAQSLRQQITEGHIAPGMRLDERTLCEQLKVSRTPLREAFRLLAADGLVEMKPNRGAYVILLSEKDINETFEIMLGLEVLSGELACKRITTHQLSKIKKLTNKMQECYESGNLPAYYKLNSEIHELISRASGNSHLVELYSRLNMRIQNIRYSSNLAKDKWSMAMKDHQEMVDALEQRDAERMAEIMKRHVKNKQRFSMSDEITSA